MKRLTAAVALTVLFFNGCKEKSPEAPVSVSREEAVKNNLDSLKKIAATGDLVVRLGDDLLSYQIKFLNETDQSYSHAGIVVEKDGQKLIAHITPDEGDKDGIQYSPVDSFLNRAKNLSAALYRYDFSPAERDSLAVAVDGYKRANVRFDKLYDLVTDTSMYCSEMISKAISGVTHGRISFRRVNVPVRMQAPLYRYFKQALSKKTIAERKIMTIDNLYRVPECRLVMQFPLKFLPGQ